MPIPSTGMITLRMGRFYEKEIDFHADHPFVVAILNDEVNNVLFMGRLSTP